MVSDTKRAILLQIDDITTRKHEILADFSLKAVSEFNLLFDERDHCTKFMDFHRKTFAVSKRRTGFNVQVYPCLERDVWKSKFNGTLESKTRQVQENELLLKVLCHNKLY
jgi:hypothetical protein